MSFPTSKSLEIPILHELAAVRGEDDIRYIYSRLIGYFPQLTDEEISSIQQNKIKNWRILVQKAGKELDDKGFIKRKRGFWKLTENGQKQVEAEATEINKR